MMFEPLPNLLVKLLEACAKHKLHHSHDRLEATMDGRNNGECRNLDRCKNDLQSLSRVLPRMEQKIIVKDTQWDDCHIEDEFQKDYVIGKKDVKRSKVIADENEEDDIRHLCALYRAIARGSFCPHAAQHLFAGGDDTMLETDSKKSDAKMARGILPRIVQLFRYVAFDPVRLTKLPLRLSILYETKSSLEQIIEELYKEEDIGATIATLLNLLNGEYSRLIAVHDLINLANDLNTVEESSVLSDSSCFVSTQSDENFADDKKNVHRFMASGRIRIRVFTELSRYLLQQSSDGNKITFIFDDVIHISSYRSILALRLGVWSSLQHFLPAVQTDWFGYPTQESLFHPSTQRFSVCEVDLLNSFLSSSRSSLHVIPLEPTLETNGLVCDYSQHDRKIHNLLILRVRLVIYELFRHMVNTASGFKKTGLIRSDMGNSFASIRKMTIFDHALVPSLQLAQITIEAVKLHLSGNQLLFHEGSKGSNNKSPSGILEECLNSLCFWSLSNLLISTILFPDHASSSRNDIWAHVVPSLLDCFPYISYSSNQVKSEVKSLIRVVLRILHTILACGNDVITGGKRFITDLFIKKCLVQGYFPQLFKLAMDSLESISSPAISIVVHLLQHSFDVHLMNSLMNALDDTEQFVIDSTMIKCQDAWDSSTSKDQRQAGQLFKSLFHIGSKHKRLGNSYFSQHLTRADASQLPLRALFIRYVTEAISEAKSIVSMIDGKCSPQFFEDATDLSTLITEEDVSSLRTVSVILRILLSLRSLTYSPGKPDNFDCVIRPLFLSLETVSKFLAFPNNIVRISIVAPDLIRSYLSLVLSIGYQFARVERKMSDDTMISNVSEREAISHCAIASLELIGLDDCLDSAHGDISTFRMKARKIHCQNLCTRLHSLSGVNALRRSDICLCRLVSNGSTRLSNECAAFIFDEYLPLQYRCILLASLFPTSSDSTRNDTTISSLHRIIANSSQSRSSVAIIASLICLPSLFLSLTLSRNEQTANSKYLIFLLNSFDFKELLIRYIQSEITVYSVSAYMCLARLIRMYSAVSLIESKKEWSENDLRYCRAANYLRNELEPSIKGMHDVLDDFYSSDCDFLSTINKDDTFHVALTAPAHAKKSFSLLAPHHLKSPVFLATYVYLQSSLAISSSSLLMSSGAFEYLHDKRHFADFESLAQFCSESKEFDSAVFSRIPAPVWLLLAPFVSHDTATRAYAAKNFGQTLLGNENQVFTALFLGPEAINAAVMSTESLMFAVETLFREIEFLLIKFFQFPQKFIFSSEFCDSVTEEDVSYENMEIVVLLYESLCQSTLLDEGVTLHIFKNSLQRLLRIWIGSSIVGRLALDSIALESNVCNTFHPSGIVFDGLRGLFTNLGQHTQASEGIDIMNYFHDIFPGIIREFFLPPAKEKIIPLTRYHLLITFIESCFFFSSRTQGLPVYKLYVPNSIEIVGFIDNFYPCVITSMIKNQDIEGLQMCAAFRMYLISEYKKQAKEEKRFRRKVKIESLIGLHNRSNCFANSSRDLVPGVTISGSTISTKKLTENMKLLCWKSDVIEFILPSLLLHSDRSVLKFFSSMCPPDSTMAQILRKKELTVLKTLAWELGVDDLLEDRIEERFQSATIPAMHSRSDVVLALKVGYLIKEGHLLTSFTEKSTDELVSASNWIAPNFLYLLVNIVLQKWSSKSQKEKFQTMKCLKAMLTFLSPAESLQYMPQIMVAINNAMTSSVISNESQLKQLDKLRFIAVATLINFLKNVAVHEVSIVEQNLISIVVTLFPLFENSKIPENCSIARKEAVVLLIWLAEISSESFKAIPFLPTTSDLDCVREILAEKGVQLDDTRLMSKRTDHQRPNALQQSTFYAKMNTLLDIASSHENKQVRMYVTIYMTDYIMRNRELFYNMVENEDLASVNFLTVVNDTSSTGSECNAGHSTGHENSITGGFVTNLLMRLLTRCVDESEQDIRDAIARCLGEIGAIDSNRLGKKINALSMGHDDSDDWRLTQPPWKSHITRYQLRLVTKHLVSGLKSATTTLDQHKIAFAIQELLKQIDAYAVATKKDYNQSIDTDEQHIAHNAPMSSWLKKKLVEADVSNIVEPYWTSTYQQHETSAAKKPPFFMISNCYFVWLSTFCRYMITKSYTNDGSVWRHLYHGIRSAIRSQAGICVAEFILPVLVLDSVCFGDKDDEDIITSEFVSALTFNMKNSSETMSCSMSLREREKTANAIFKVIDVLRHWMEQEMEQIHHSPRSKTKKRARLSSFDQTSDSWPIEESISRIAHFLKSIPLSTCAIAAKNVGMNARALRFIEIDSRSKSQMSACNQSLDTCNAPQYLSSHHLDGIDLDLIQALFRQLNDFDTMVNIAQRRQNRRSGSTQRLINDAAEKEIYGDVEGSFHAFENLLDTRLLREIAIQSSDYTIIDCTKLSAQKGLLRCLLKLGRLDSVLNQAYGMSIKFNDHHESSRLSDELLPSAVEAAWRLGNWTLLETLVSADTKTTYDPNDLYQLSFGRTINSLHNRYPETFFLCLKDARESVMSSLSRAARDSYSRTYPCLMQLHALREVECAASDFFSDTSKLRVFSPDEWRRRLCLSAPDTAGSNAIINTRLVLSRIANDTITEGGVWLHIGKMARKGGFYQIAEQCLTHADVLFCASRTKPSRDDNTLLLANELLAKVKLQFAKLKYAMGESTTAIKLIEDDIPLAVLHLNDKQLHSVETNNDTENMEITGRLILQTTEWMVSDGLKSVFEIKNRYHTVLKMVPMWERAHFHFGKYLDMLYETCITKCDDQLWTGVNIMAKRANVIASNEQCRRFVLDAVHHYGIALQLGQKHVYQALPRLFSMWLEFTNILQNQASNDNHQKGKLKLNDAFLNDQTEMNKLIKSFISKIPAHLFYTAIPQLISSVLHGNEETGRCVKQILITVLSKYPGQALWSCGWLRFSKAEEKKKAGEEIFRGAQKQLLKIERGAKFQSILDTSKNLFQFLIHVAQFVPKSNATSVKMKVPKFDVELASFIPPVQAALSLTPGALDLSDVKDIFPPFVPRMRAFNSELKIMQSKAKPKKVSVFAVPSAAAQRGTLPDQCHTVTQDIGEMHFLVKQEAKGDLRKDSRVQDLNTVINRLFSGRKGSSGPNSHRQRLRLHLRTFSVVCLTEDCGILEWVPNTDSFRGLVGKTYNPQVAPNSIHRRGHRVTNFNDIELRETFMKCQDLFFKKGDLILAAKNFNELILKQYVPIMYWWFVHNFSNPHAWFEARNNFTLSTAVWSAVGHIIGLGDRHTENILVDTSSGECVHVDFDCIFDKGLLLPRPEVIPFRLTPNMIDAFGPIGVDGLFTGALMESMKTLRQNRDTLLSVLEPFLKDPVINFQSSKTQQKPLEGSAKAVENMINIDGRLKGIYNLDNPNMKKVMRRDGFSKNERDDVAHVTLSVEGQVLKMIMEATSHENLVQVYVGWMPWV